MFIILVLILISIGLILKNEHFVRKKYKQESGISYGNAFEDKGMYGEKSSIKLSEDRINGLYYVLKNYSNADESVKAAHVDNINKYKNREKSSSNKRTYNKEDDNKSNSTDYVDYNFKTTYDISNKDINDKSSTSKEDFMSGKLEDALKSYRLNKSKELGIKPYVIFTDKEMEDIILLKPNSINELCRINGIGQVKCNKYGEDIVRIVMENL